MADDLYERLAEDREQHSNADYLRLHPDKERPTEMMKKWKKRRKRRQEQATDILRLSPEKAAQLLRQLERAGIGDAETRLLLAQRGQLSEQPGEAAAMKMYETAIRAGRRVKYGTFHAEFRTVQVPDDLRQAVEEAIEEDTP
jgi:hypothetical protein